MCKARGLTLPGERYSQSKKASTSLTGAILPLSTQLGADSLPAKTKQLYSWDLNVRLQSLRRGYPDSCGSLCNQLGISHMSTSDAFLT